MSGKAMLTMNRSRLAMKTAADTTARTGAMRVERSSTVSSLGELISSLKEPSPLRSVRAVAHIRRPGLLSSPLPLGDRRPLDAADRARRLPRPQALPGVRGRPGHPEEGPDR